MKILLPQILLLQTLLNKDSTAFVRSVATSTTGFRSRGRTPI